MNRDDHARLEIAPVEVSDPADPRVALYRDSRDADLRGRHGVFLVESEACIRRWLDAVARRRGGEVLPPALGIESLLLGHEVFDRLRRAIAEAGAVRVFVAPSALVEGISGFDHHHGALGLGRREGLDDGSALPALLDRIGSAAPDDEIRGRPIVSALVGRDSGNRPRVSSTLVVTDGVVHVDNMGSIFRNAAALGAAGVLLSGRCADPLVRKTIRISMGHVFGVPWAVASDLAEALRTLKRRGWRVLVAENDAGAVDIEREPFDDRVACVFGAEGHGVSSPTRALADAVVRVPSRDGVPLNVAIASAIVLHEAARAERQRAAGGRR